ncbi:hypothetical protein OT109_11295 [Phycisphaeraceae bacterium D3-23]
MAGTMRLDVHDWDLHAAGPLLVFIPSGKTKARQYLITLVAAVIAAGVMFYWGVPPGGRPAKQQREVVAQAEQAVEQSEDRLKMFENSGSVGELHRAQVEGARRQLDASRATLAQQRERLRLMPKRLGPTGSALFWSALALLGLIGLGYPQLARFERLVIREDRGVIQIKHRLQPWAARRLDPKRIAAIGLHARRVVTVHRDTDSGPRQVTGQGWVWSVVLLNAQGDAGQPAVELLCDHEHYLDNDPGTLTRRVRDTAGYFERLTGLKAQGVVTSDASPELTHGHRAYKRSN